MPNKEAEFEKEAEEYRKENLCKKCHKHCKEGMCTCSECKIKTFKDGAETGYNKAAGDPKRIIKDLVDLLMCLEGVRVADMGTVKEAKQYLKEVDNA